MEVMLKNAADAPLASRPFFSLCNRNKKISQVKTEHLPVRKWIQPPSVWP